jgi:23S rRNA (cytosine1962-C5)-methyltransferase
MTPDDLSPRLGAALDARADLFDARRETAFRLFNGFLEGCPEIVVDLYGSTAVLHNYADVPEAADALVERASELLRARLPWLSAVVLKPRKAIDPEVRRGRLVYGETLDRRVREHGVWYALELLLNRDASFYLDTRNLRAWAIERLGGASVLNTFAYTGSLGVAARAAGARRVVHVDLNRQFLNVAKSSYTLNGFPIHKADFIGGDFWTKMNFLKRQGGLFDCVFVDPPFFSTTSRGTVDLVAQSHRVLNKVRPLVADGGWLVAINNALFVSGAEYLALLERLCADGYLSVESLVPVPVDVTGYSGTRTNAEPVDPAPFNSSTKIAILRVRRKDAKTS